MEKIKVIIADDIQAIVESNKRIVASFDNVEVIVTAYNGQYEYEMIINLQPDFVSNRREVEVDMEKCKKRNTEHCTKSKFCAKSNRSKIYRL